MHSVGGGEGAPRVGVSLVLLALLVGAAPARAAGQAAPPASSASPSTSPEKPSGEAAAPEEEEVHSQVASFAITRLTDSPAVVTAVSSEEIRSSGARDLMDVLLLVPGFFFGVDVQGNIGPGFRGLWGVEGKILLLIDGKEMNEQLYSTVQLGHEFPVELIERVEVVRGPGSVIYGGNAELAVVNVITRNAQGSTDLLASATYGQMGTTYGRRGGVVSGRLVVEQVPGLSSFFSAAYSQGQRSDALYRDFAGTEVSMIGASEMDMLTIQGGVSFRDFQLSVLYHRLDTNGIDGFDVALTQPAASNFDSLHADASYTFRPAERLEITPRFTFSQQSPYRNLDPTSDFFYDKTFTRLRGRLTGRWAPVDFLQITAGADVIADQAVLNEPAGPGLQTAFNTDQSFIAYQNYAGFLELYSENPIVTAVAGARYEHHSLFGDSFVPRLVLLRSFGPFSAKALASAAFRAPGVEDINLGANVGPEHTTAFELEASFRPAEGHVLSLNAFDASIRDPIVYSYNAASGSEAYQNLGRLGSRGFELEYHLHQSWGRIGLSYSFYTPAGVNDVASYQVPGHSEAFAGMPTNKLAFTGHFKVLPWLSIDPTAVLLGDRYAVEAPDDVTGVAPVEVLPTQLLANLFLRAENVGVRGLEIGAGVYNILGADFRVAQPYDGGHAPLPVFSREFLLRLTYSLDVGAASEPEPEPVK
jgi:outer membrane receptor protein involved in Fe transport